MYSLGLLSLHPDCIYGLEHMVYVFNVHSGIVLHEGYSVIQEASATENDTCKRGDGKLDNIMIFDRRDGEHKIHRACMMSCEKSI